MDVTQLLSAILTSLIGWILYWAYRKTKYFEERGIPFKKPLLFFGNTFNVLLLRTTNAKVLTELAENEFHDVPIFGYFESIKPVVVVKDFELINRIFVKDFHHFVDHGIEIDVDKNPYDSNLFNMAGNRWRAFRHKFSPMFTSGKLKNMSNEMITLTENMIDVVEKRNLKKDLDLLELFCQLSMDIIGSCGYGLDTKILGNEESEYRKMGKKVFHMDFKRYIRVSTILAFPKLAKAMGVSFNDRDVLEYFGGVVRDTLQHRMKGDYQRNDFVQLMLTLKEKGTIEITSRDASDDYLGLDSNENYSTEKFDLNYDEIVGNALSFLTLGFEATALTMLYLCYDLTQNQESQDRLREEINNVIDWKGKLTYDAIKNMSYLDMCLKESQRIHTLGAEVFRVCTQEYTFPGTNVTVKPGQSVKIPAQAIHMNPDVYPDPKRFNPDRFADGGVNIPAGAFIPFGDGPRICIAMRFAILEVKIAVVQILRRYKLTLSPKSKPLRFNPMHFMPSPQDPQYFDLENVPQK